MTTAASALAAMRIASLLPLGVVDAGPDARRRRTRLPKRSWTGGLHRAGPDAALSPDFRPDVTLRFGTASRVPARSIEIRGLREQLGLTAPAPCRERDDDPSCA